jgi:hypothetical protein
MSWLSEFAGGGGLGLLPQMLFDGGKSNGGGSKRDGAPQPLPGVNPNLTPQANFWQGNQLQIPGFMPGQQSPRPQGLPGMGGLAGGLGGGGMPQGGGAPQGGLAQGLSGAGGNPMIAHLLQMLQGQQRQY